MLPKSICFVLAGLLVVVPLWILMSYGITADGRPSSPKILIGMTFCFVVGVLRSLGLHFELLDERSDAACSARTMASQ
jgi:hypothetical protein